MKRRAEFIKINDAITLINDANESTYYLVCGTQKALMIDTGNGYEDVMAIAREITELPVEVVNTHGHCDHVYGNMYCKEAFMHPADVPICQEHFRHEELLRFVPNAICCPLYPVSEGMLFDLGNLELEVIEMIGHTPGSIGLLDRKHRILFSGDAVNPYIWLQLPESLPISQFRKNIGEMMKMYGEQFDYHLSGHTTQRIPKQAIYDLLAGCDEIIAGNTTEDIDSEWFGGICKGHKYGDRIGKQICYDPKKI